jgi:tRNA1(Val) A37 N6-methylase TrmN6
MPILRRTYPTLTKDRYDIILANPPFGGKNALRCSKLPYKTGNGFVVYAALH